MNIGSYTFEQFKQRAAEFHSYPAPGLLLGGYMVEMAKAALAPGVLFEAVVETKKCLPDAVQLLTLCSVGNQWMHILDLGKYALSLYDKYTGAGFRVHVDTKRLSVYAEISAWFLKTKDKKDQDSDLLLKEIEQAGDSICDIVPVRIAPHFLAHKGQGLIQICPRCGEAYPVSDGAVCKGCQGAAPYSSFQGQDARPLTCVIPVEDAVGRVALHDMTEIIPGVSKSVAVSAGQTIRAEDVARLRRMGRFTVAVTAGELAKPEDFVHENDAVSALAGRMAGEHLEFDLPPKEGKILFRAKYARVICFIHSYIILYDLLVNL
jgi:formylmethanofuran dehydrogenase subunit E